MADAIPEGQACRKGRARKDIGGQRRRHLGDIRQGHEGEGYAGVQGALQPGMVALEHIPSY